MNWREFPLSWRDAFLSVAAGGVLFAGIWIGLSFVIPGDGALYATLGLYSLAAIGILLRASRRRP